VAETLFKKYGNLNDYIDAVQEELENDIRPTGFYKNKAKAIKNIAREIRDRFQGEIPRDIDTFATVKGIGRKSANLIIGLAFDKPAVVVDTHVIRLSNRIGFSDKKDPDKIELDIKKTVPEDLWTSFSLLITLHGRYLCKARRPECERCLLQNDCDYFTGRRSDV
jgi:endonuclease-3